jgi:hypothetical protein
VLHLLLKDQDPLDLQPELWEQGREDLPYDEKARRPVAHLMVRVRQQRLRHEVSRLLQAQFDRLGVLRRLQGNVDRVKLRVIDEGGRCGSRR